MRMGLMETLIMCDVAVCIKITFMKHLNVEGNCGISFDFSMWSTPQKYNSKRGSEICLGSPRTIVRKHPSFSLLYSHSTT
jgi:hypothetical protein